MPDEVNFFDELLTNEIALSDLSHEEQLQIGIDSYGPYESHLNTTGGEYWLEDAINIDAVATDGISAITDQDSYNGWYHVRNFNTPYQMIVPTKSEEEEYDGLFLYSKRDWLLKKGFFELANEILNAPVIRGCTNPDAWNFNPLATEDDGSCFIMQGYLFGQIPTETMNGLHTTGGELILADTMIEYRGYYHVHGPGGLPSFPDGTSVVAGSILTGKVFDGTNKLLLPVDAEARFNQHLAGIDPTEGEETINRKIWHDLIIADEQYSSLEGQLRGNMATTLNIEVNTTSAGEGKDFVAFDNVVTFPDAVGIMQETEYEFQHLLQDETKVPGIYGMKPRIVSDLNQIDFSPETIAPHIQNDTTDLPDDMSTGGVG